MNELLPLEDALGGHFKLWFSVAEGRQTRKEERLTTHLRDHWNQNIGVIYPTRL